MHALPGVMSKRMKWKGWQVKRARPWAVAGAPTAADLGGKRMEIEGFLAAAGQGQAVSGYTPDSSVPAGTPEPAEPTG